MTIAVFALLLPAITGIIVTLNTVNDRAREQAIVHSLAETKAEELRSIGFEGISNGTTDFSSELPDMLS
ncbi:MAG: hypothetical protein ACREQV_13085, partial [Candidatus Binatia bacterium]